MSTHQGLAVVAVVTLFVACAAPEGDDVAPNAGDVGPGGSSPNAPDATIDLGSPGPTRSDGGTARPTTDSLTITLRDFKRYDPSDPTTNPDFENVPAKDGQGNPSPGYKGPWDDRAIVTGALGPDGKPVYRSTTGTTLTTHGEAAFDQWYRDVRGTNYTVSIPLKLARSPSGLYEYDSEKVGIPLSPSDPTKMFFPLDDGGQYSTPFGNQGSLHNYCFTVELHTRFTYRGGEFFGFRGDDDIFVYIDGKLVIDLGGIHGPSSARVDIGSLGLVVGSDHTLDFFAAERHETGSNILFSTSLELRDVDVR
jgi:fibro-slime domain-containing protein